VWWMSLTRSQLFLQTFRPDIAPDTVPTVQLLDDGNDIQNATAAAVGADLEANLDIQVCRLSFFRKATSSNVYQ
jgi:hypothetical protein